MGASTVQLVLQRIFTIMAQFHASDLHISVGNMPTLRVNGRLIPIEKEPMITKEFIEEILSFVISEEEKKELEAKKELFIAHEFFEKARFRIHIFFQQGFPSLSFRMMSNRTPVMKELDLPPIYSFASEPKEGLFLIGGTYGSGRTTSLAAIINTINNTQNFRIMTLEKPIEYIFLDNKSMVEQREVGKDTASFLDGLESAMHEDIDVFMLSDVENTEIFRKTLELAEAKKAVYACMNGPSIVRILEKMTQDKDDAGSERLRSALAGVLVGIVVQKLIPGIDEAPKMAVEYMIPDESVRNMIRDGSWSQIDDAIQNSRNKSAQAMDESLVELVRQRKISLERALENADDTTRLQTTLQNINQ